MAETGRRKVKNVKVTDAEKRRFPSKHYVYIINITWDDGSDTVIYRRYSKFFDFQISLLEMFPKEGGLKDPLLRIIPFLPGKILFGRSHVRDVAMKRLKPIDEYCQALIQLPAYISESDHVLDFFETKPEDLAPFKDDVLYRRRSNQESVARRSVSLRRSVRRTCSFDISEISGPIILEQYIAIADYESTQSKELTIYNGQTVEVIEKNENGWWFISNDEGERGWVPGVYLEKPDGTSEDLITNQLEPGHGESFITTHAYKADNPDEVSFPAGVVVEVLQKNLEGWWRIIFNGKEGFAPASYLEKTTDWSGTKPVANDTVSALKNTKHRHSLPNSNSLTCISHPTLIDSTSNLVSVDVHDLKPGHNSVVLRHTQHDKINGRSTESYTDVKNKWARKTTQVQAPPKRRSTIKRSKKPQVPPPLPPTPMSSPESEYEYMTVASFKADIPDGVSFESGKSVKVLEKSPGGWWFINNNGKEGWAPASYIEKRLKKLINPVAKNVPPERPNPPAQQNIPKAKAPLQVTHSASSLLEKNPLKRVILGQENSVGMSRSQSVVSPATRPLPPLPTNQGVNKQVTKTPHLQHLSIARKQSDHEIEMLRPPPEPPVNNTSSNLPSETKPSVKAEEPPLDFRSALKASLSNVAERKHETKELSQSKQPVAAVHPLKPNNFSSRTKSNSSLNTNKSTALGKKNPELPSKPKPLGAVSSKRLVESSKSSGDEAGPVDFRSVLKPSTRRPGAKTPANRSSSFNNSTKPVLSKKPTNVKPSSNLRTSTSVVNKNPPILPQKPPSVNKPSIVKKPKTPTSSPIRNANKHKVTGANKPEKKVQNTKPVLKRLQANSNINDNSNKPVFAIGRVEVELSTPDLSSTFPVRGSPDGEVDMTKFSEAKTRDKNQLTKSKQTVSEHDSISKRISQCSDYSNEDVMTKLVAVKDYVGIEECEISFYKGDEAYLVDKAENSWWYVQIGQRSGWAPSTYFETLGSADSGFLTGSKRNSATDSISGNSSDVDQTSVIIKDNELTPTAELVYSTIEDAINKQRNSMNVTVYRAATDFVASDSSMMSFNEGDKMTIGEHSDSGWCFATLLDGTSEGWVPSSYIDPIETN